jgi:ATP-binding protein involved in chromosome partitioning
MSYVRCPHGEKMELFGRGGGQHLADALNVPLLANIPLEAEVRMGGDSGTPVIVGQPNSEAARAFASLAERIEQRIPASLAASR